MRKIVISGIGLALGAAVALAPWAAAGGQGAARSGLSPQSDDNNNMCTPGSGAGGNGFTIFNAPGKPGATIKFNGEVSLKGGDPGTMYTVMLSKDGGNCTAAGEIVTNGQGNGNAHMLQPGPGAGDYYVVLINNTTMEEQFASGTVTIS